MANELTTQYLYRNAYQKTAPASGNDNSLAQWITAASEAIGRYCDRTFGVTTYRRWLDGSGTPQIVLPDFPIVAVYGMATTTAIALQVKNTTAQFATVSTDETTMQLFSISTLGVEATTSITLSSYPTITLLAAYINTLTGWTATITTGMDNEPTTLIKPYQNDYAVSPSYFQCEIASDFEPMRIRSESNRVVERMFGNLGTFTGDQAIWYPYRMSTLGSIIPEGRSNVFCWYKAGYTLPVDNASHSTLATAGNVPASLTQIANNIVKGLEDSVNQTIGGAQSENIGDYSYSMDEGGRAIIQKLILENASSLSPFRRLTLWA